MSIKLTHSKSYTGISYMYMYVHTCIMPYLFSGLICSSNFPFCYSIYFGLLLYINRFFPISDVDNLKMCLNYTFSSLIIGKMRCKKVNRYYNEGNLAYCIFVPSQEQTHLKCNAILYVGFRVTF